MKFIDSSLHRKIYRWLNPGDYKIIKLKAMWVAVRHEESGCWHTTIGLPKKELKNMSCRYYSWPYFHGHLVEMLYSIRDEYNDSFNKKRKY